MAPWFYTSKDLKHWSHPKVVFTVPENFWAEQGGWAPEVHQHKGKFYLFTTLHNDTDGPELFRTKDGHLLMLWSSYEHLSDKTPGSHYVQTIARSQSGELKGPWIQLRPLVHQDSGHGMLFRTFEGQLMMVLHRPFHGARGKLYEMRDQGDHLEVIKERTDLDGDS